MKYLDFFALIKSTGINTIYSHFSAATTPPFICVLASKEADGSDFSNELENITYRVEFYSKLNYDHANFTKIEQLFDSRGIKYTADYGIWIEADNTFMTIYNVEFYNKK